MSDHLHQAIEAALAAVGYPEAPEGLYEPIRYVLDGGGKRLRPTLLLMAYDLYRPGHTAEAMPAAVGIEMYHNHTLLHDDLMDRADMRHGRPTVHKAWNDNTAILSGDTMLIMAAQHVAEARSPHAAEAMRLFLRSAREVCEGQQHDVNFERRADVTEEEYLEMIRLKTSVLLACAASLGAVLAGAPRSDVKALHAFAEAIGLAFQLQDDYLDVYGDPALFGKKNGGDILCGKKNYLLINALRLADAGTRRLLLETPGAALPDEEKIARVTDVYDRLGIGPLTLQAIDRHYAEARRHLSALSVDEELTAPLWHYACSLLGRKK